MHRLSRRSILLGGMVAASGGMALGTGRLAGLTGTSGLSGFAPAGAATPATAPLMESMIAFLKSIEHKIPGACLASVDLVTDAVDTYAIGWADHVAEKKFAPDTIVSIDSATKMFTALVLAQAVSGGLGRNGPITLDATIDSYLQPYFDLYGGTIPALISGITLRQLANYTSGFPEHPDNEHIPADYTIAELFTWLGEISSLEVTPGTAYFYSDFAVALLGFILADQLTLPSSPGNPDFEVLIQQQLLGPSVLNMGDTQMQTTPAQQPRVASGHVYVTPPPHAQFGPAPTVTDPPSFLGGGGGLRTTATDMTILLRALLDPPQVAHLADAMPLLHRVSFNGPSSGGGTIQTGIGWVPITSKDGETIFLKNGGGSDGFFTLMGIAPSTRRALFFSTNVDALSTPIGVTEAFVTHLAEQSPAPSTTTSIVNPSTTSSTSDTDSDPAAGAAAATPRFTG